MVYDDKTWQHMVYPWKILVYHDKLWTSMDIYGHLWTSMDIMLYLFHGQIMETHGESMVK